MFSYACPSCAQKLLAPPERAGQRTMCPKCLKPLTIPAPEPADDDPDPHDGLLHAGPLVDEDAPTHPTNVLSSTPPPPRPAAVLPDPVFDPPPPPPRPVPRPEPAVQPQPVAHRAEPVAVADPPRPAPRPTPAPGPVATPVVSRPARVTTAVPTRLRPTADPAGQVVFNPTGLAGVDLAADLTAALTLRMKPPPEPAADLLLINLAWAGGTLLAAGLWVTGVLYEPDALPFVALLGVLAVAVGYLWAGYAARTPVRRWLTVGTAAAVAAGLAWVIARQVRPDWADRPSNFLPAVLLPVGSLLLAAPARLLRSRPLRFILTGEALVLLFVVSPAARQAVQGVVDRLQPPVVAAPPLRPAEKVRTLADRKASDGLLVALAELADPDAPKGTDPDARAELVGELVARSAPATESRAEVRAAALAALAVWQPDATRPAVLAAVKSADPAERQKGLALAGRWADPEVAGAVAARLSDRADSAAAQKALRAVGGPAAEGALVPLLSTEERGATLLVIMELLEAVGGRPALAALRKVEATGTSPSVREEAKARADGLEAKLRK